MIRLPRFVAEESGSPDGIKRRFFLGLFAVDVAVLTALLLFPGLDALGPARVPFLAGVLTLVFAAAMALWRFPSTLPMIEHTFVLVIAVGALASPAQALLSDASAATRVRALTDFGTWAPLLYVFAYLIFGSRTGLRLSLGFLLVGTITIVAAAGGPGVDPSATAQYIMASITYILVLHMFALVLERTVQRKERAESAAQFAFKDPLTGLGNRLHLQEQLEKAMQRRLRNGAGFALCMLDLDDFKSINDRFGHHGGDELLAALGVRLANAVRGVDTVARMGGDEFALIGADVADDGAAEAFARRIVAVFDAPFLIGDRGVSVTGTVGVCRSGDEDIEPATLMVQADAAMYSAKRGGKAQISLFRGNVDPSAADRVDLSGPLALALDRGELAVHYQPLYDLGGGGWVGVEALLRWHHPALGDIAPARFVPVAEKTGLIHELGAWVLATACRQVAEWQREGRTPFRLAVNVSVVQFVGRDFPAVVRRELAATGLSPDLLELEITERVVTQEGVTEALEELRDLGIRVALDDFGTGYSSLGRLKDLPIDGFKIDRAFVNAVQSPRDATQTALVLLQAMVSMADGLGLSVVAEGVETSGQMEALRATGCRVAQGFLLARPMPAADITALLEREPIATGPRSQPRIGWGLPEPA